ncbi:MAG TPA: addiction module protein [Planctomycetota bacterium]
MEAANERVYKEALSLPCDARLDLVEKLLQSLNLPVREDIERLWAEEAERRITEIETGQVKLVAGEEVFAKIRAKFAR